MERVFSQVDIVKSPRANRRHGSTVTDIFLASQAMSNKECNLR